MKAPHNVIIVILVVIAVAEGAYIVDLHRRIDSVSSANQLRQPPKSAQSDTITGSWRIRTKPRWVDAAYLAFNSNSWQFMPEGVCNLGTASGTYQLVPPNRVKVQLPMQLATPGFTGIFEIKTSENTLTLTNLAHPEPVILERSAK